MGFNNNSTLSSRVAPYAFNSSAANAAGTTTLGPIDHGIFMRGMFVLNCATVASGATVTINLLQSTTSGGTYKALGVARTIPLVGPLAPGIVVVDIDGERELDMTNGFQFSQVQMIVGAGTVTFDGVAFGGDCREESAGSESPATVSFSS